MKKLITTLFVSSLLVALTWLWPSFHAATRSAEFQGPLVKAHFVDMGQANAKLLEFRCGAVLVDASAQDEVVETNSRWSTGTTGGVEDSNERRCPLRGW